MKYKICSFLVFCLAVLSVVSIKTPNVPLLFDYLPYQNATYCFYTQNFCGDIKNTEKIQNGAENIVCCGAKFASQTKRQLQFVFGESICLEAYCQNQKNCLIKKILPIAKKIENIDEIEIFYCFDASLPKYVVVFEQKINLRVAVAKNALTVGYPLILGDY